MKEENFSPRKREFLFIGGIFPSFSFFHSFHVAQKSIKRDSSGKIMIKIGIWIINFTNFSRWTLDGVSSIIHNTMKFCICNVINLFAKVSKIFRSKSFALLDDETEKLLDLHGKFTRMENLMGLKWSRCSWNKLFASSLSARQRITILQKKRKTLLSRARFLDVKH